MNLADFEDFCLVDLDQGTRTARKRANLLAHMIEEYAFDVEAFVDSLEGAKKEQRRLLARIRRSDMGNGSGNYSRVLYALGEFAGHDGFEAQYLKLQPVEPKAYSKPEWEAILAFRFPRDRIWEAQLRALNSVAYYTAMRPGEVAKMTLPDLDPENSRIHVSHPEKGGRPRWLPVEPECFSPKRSLAAWLRVRVDQPGAETGALWLSRRYRGKGGKPATVDTLRNAVNRYVVPATGVDVEGHRFRHTRAVVLYRATKDPVFVKEYLGHRKLETTWEYLRSLVGQLGNDFNKFDMPSMRRALD